MASITQLHLLPTKLGEEAMVLVKVYENLVDQRCLEIEDEKKRKAADIKSMVCPLSMLPRQVLSKCYCILVFTKCLAQHQSNLYFFLMGLPSQEEVSMYMFCVLRNYFACLSRFWIYVKKMWRLVWLKYLYTVNTEYTLYKYVIIKYSRYNPLKWMVNSHQLQSN